MLKTITLARALKEKNRIAGKLATVRQKILEENSWESPNNRNIDVETYYQRENKLMFLLINLKAEIAKANKNIVAAIIELAEIKSKIAWLQRVPTKAGTFQENSYGGSLSRVFTASMSNACIENEINCLQERADNLQDEIDEFNASTRIEVDLDD